MTPSSKMLSGGGSGARPSWRLAELRGRLASGGHVQRAAAAELAQGRQQGAGEASPSQFARLAGDRLPVAGMRLLVAATAHIEHWYDTEEAGGWGDAIDAKVLAGRWRTAIGEAVRLEGEL